MSRRRYRVGRRKEYNRYLRKYRAARKRLEDKGLTPYDGIEMSFSEYFMNKSDLLKEKGSNQNLQRDLIQKQLYKFSYEQTIALRKALKDSKFAPEGYTDLSLLQMRTGEGYELDFLSDVNEDLKRRFP